ncbi:MAG TPA: phage tail sheath C-terminal domain-containing protein [Verrucomicrobiae bacterium]|nr:phage tail sheath C-terminal domain-containing protein [Verrucomicrobiae bacterium]
MPTYETPKVYIQEITSPGVIAGVTTSTAAFIGPALTGPINVPTFITTFDDFLQKFGVLQTDGSYMPYMQGYYMAYGVRSFFDNDGSYAYILRIGTARVTTWEIDNQKGEAVFRLQAQTDGTAGDNIQVAVAAANLTGVNGVAVATGKATVQGVNGVLVSVDKPNVFNVSDVVTKDQVARATIQKIQGNVLTLSTTLTLANGDTLVIANIIPSSDPNTPITFRMAQTTGLEAGSVVLIQGDDANNPGTTVSDYAVLQDVDKAGFVTIPGQPNLTHSYNLGAAKPPVLISQEFQLTVTPPAGVAEVFNNLSLNPLHPGYVFTAVDSDSVNVLPPLVPPIALNYPDPLAQPTNPVPISIHGQQDNPAQLGVADYQTALDSLLNVEGINTVCVPDAAANSGYIGIQAAMIEHCVQSQDRFAVLDSRLGAPPSDAGSVDVHRQQLTQDRDGAFAALYYPWLMIPDPTNKKPNAPPIPIPPSGAIAGIYARVDNDRGVHKAPANVDIWGVVGLKTTLSDRQQGPLNLEGVNVLRIFHGTAQAMVWGARTLDTQDTDWKYVSTRRLMIYIEQSIEAGIRWAVFEPNNLSLWNKLKRTITEFLTRLWRAGALFGAKAENAFYVRIDEGLNPASTRALGQLFIEIGVQPAYPAEFIIVRIGVWDGGAQISES